ncbi:MAG: type IV pilus assembly protein PilM [Solirubrobacterales bacterium]|nr:type IV pilus assembly protein PilM [Solirubrobacterales bacterium]
MRTTKKGPNIVGLDIGTATVAAVELRVNGSVSVEKTAIAPLPEGASQDGEVADADALSATLKDFFTTAKLGKDVRIGVANQRVVVRTLRMPRVEKQGEIENAIRFMAQEQMQMPLDDAVVDWQVLDSSPEVAASGQMDVAVAAARWDMVRPLVDTVRAAGLRPVGVDVSAFGMIRALSKEPAIAASGPYAAGAPAPQADGIPSQPARLFCSLGDVTNLAIARGAGCLFTRVFPYGMEAIAATLGERQGLTLEHARMWIGHVGLEAPIDQIAGEPAIVAVAREVLLEGVSKLAAEIRLSLDYYGSQGEAVAIEEVIVCGSGSAVPGLPAALQAELGLALRPARPVALAGFPTPDASRLTVPFGLALEE